jgi:hypothetical protein
MAGDDRIAEVLGKLGVSIHELLRYGYGGLLSFLVAAAAYPTETQGALKALGTPIAVLAAFAIGGAIYAAYRPLGQLVDWLHWAIHYPINRLQNSYTCRTWVLVTQYKVRWWQAENAYRCIRDSDKFNEKMRERFYRQHSETHVLYVTFLVLLVGGIVICIAGPQGAHPVLKATLFAGAILSFLLGIRTDMLVCAQECKYMLVNIKSKDIEDILAKGKFVKETGQNYETDAPKSAQG